jgi:hypothetical protein
MFDETIPDNIFHLKAKIPILNLTYFLILFKTHDILIIKNKQKHGTHVNTL